MKIIVSLKEIIEATGKSRRALLYTLKDCERKNTGKKTERGYYFESLPEDIRILVHDYRLKNSLPCESNNLPVPKKQAALVKVSVSKLSEEDDKHAQSEYRLIVAWRERVKRAGYGMKKVVTKDFLTAYNSGALFPDIYKDVGKISVKTIYKKNKILLDHDDDYLSLVDKRKVKNGNQSHLSEQEKEYYLKCYLQPKVNYIDAYRGVREIFIKQGIEEIPSESTFRRWFTKQFAPYNEHVIVMSREGEKAYKDKVGPYMTRDDSKLKPGDVLVADGHKLNFWSKHPVTGKKVRLILIVFFDWASRFPVGWQLMPTESTIAVTGALRLGILVLGKKPTCVYLDNGRAFKNKYFLETNPDFEEMHGLYARLGIAVQYAQPYNARAKLVEPFFGTMNEQFEKRVPTYCGANINDKPPHLHRNEKFHQKEYEKKYGDWVPDIRETAHMIDLYFKWYGNNPHSGIKNQKPLDILTPAMGPGVDAQELEYQMLWTMKKKPSNCRIKSFWGVDYEGDFLHGVNMELVIKYDTSDLREVYCYTSDGIRLGTAKAVQAIHPVAKVFNDKMGMDDVKREMKRQNRLKKRTIEAVKEVGGSAEDVDYVKSLPEWSKKVALIPENTGVKRDSELSEFEIKRLEKIALEAEQEMIAESEKALDAYVDRPEYFSSEYERYDWCFEVRFKKGLALNDEDLAYMKYFETTDVFKNNYKGRYDDLLVLYGVAA